MVLQKLHPWVRQVLQLGGMTKQEAFMRELAFLSSVPDLQALLALCVGTRACLAVLFEGVKGMNPAPHIHEHLRYTIMATALRTPSRITTSRLSTLR